MLHKPINILYTYRYSCTCYHAFWLCDCSLTWHDIIEEASFFNERISLIIFLYWAGHSCVPQCECQKEPNYEHITDIINGSLSIMLHFYSSFHQPTTQGFPPFLPPFLYALFSWLRVNRAVIFLYNIGTLHYNYIYSKYWHSVECISD